MAAILTAFAFGFEIPGNPLQEGSVLDSTSSPSPMPTVPETARPVARTYLVREGDTLRGIARKFYGSEADWHRIYTRNRGRIDDPAALQVGQLLVIPAQ